MNSSLNLGIYNYFCLAYGEVLKVVQKLGSVLSEWLNQGDLVGISGVNTVEWYITDIMCALYGFVSVPLQNYTVAILEVMRKTK